MTDDRIDEGITRASAAKASSEPLRSASVAVGSAPEVALNWAGFFVGLVVMTGDYIVARRSITPENWAFLASPRAMVSIFFVAAQLGFWASIVEPLWR